MTYVECHERDPRTRHQPVARTYCRFWLDGSPIRLGKGPEVTCPHCIKARAKHNPNT